MKNHKLKNRLFLSGCIVSLTTLLVPTLASAQNANTVQDANKFDEIIVTARKRAESLQDVPEAVTAFTLSDIESAGIDDVADFVELTPNVIIRETFRAGVTFITVRGITTGQQGWAPVTFVVDGVQAGSLDAINQGALLDLEQIEVLKGPQGALYGAGAIAGAINITTKKPSDVVEGGVKLRYGKGDDKTVSAVISGPIVEGKLRGLVSGYYRDADGLIDSVDGRDLDFEEQATIRGRLIYDASDDLTFDLRGSYSDIEAGAAFQDKLFDAADVDQFDNDRAPGPVRGRLGVENREFVEGSLKIDWETDLGTFTSVSGYSDIQQDLDGSASWDNPLRPGAQGAFGPLNGAIALGGTDTVFDNFQQLQDNFKVFTQDVRLTSNNEGPFRWLVGASYLDREVENLLNVGFVVNEASGPLASAFQRFDVRNDQAWGLYGQVNYDISDRLELTLAGRYDENDFDTTHYTDATATTVVTTLDTEGNVVDTLQNTDSKFQPKATLSYDISDNVMGYVTYAEGFRYGFFNTGNLTKSESTKNYEAGIKSQFGPVTLNAAAFRIDYSDQQFTSLITVPPFRVTTNLPPTTINGIEVEFTANLSDNFKLFGGLGLLDAEQDNGFKSPATPPITFNLGGAYNGKIGEFDHTARIDMRSQGRFFLGPIEEYTVSAKQYINLRTSIGKNNWSIAAFADNILDERQANDFSPLAGGIIRAQSKPGTYGVELGYKF